jgi:hypothetical protein
VVAALVAAGLNVGRYGFLPAAPHTDLWRGRVQFYRPDMALAREHAIIMNAVSHNIILPPPNVFSMTGGFLVAVTTAICVSLVNVMVIARDMSWLATVGTDPAARMEAILSVTYEVIFIMAVMPRPGGQPDHFLFPQPEASVPE